MATPDDYLNEDFDPNINPEDYKIENLDNLIADRGLDPNKYKVSLPQTPTPESQALDSPEAIDDFLSGMHHFYHPASNPLAPGKTQVFGAGMDHHQYQRYYSHPDFKRLGFSPFRDNETLYNENGSVLGDFMRAKSQFWNLVGIGFTDAAGFGDISDKDAAKEFENAMAIGQSSRGGIAGFSTNLFLNSGYTFGIIGEIAAEEALLLAGTALTGGGLGGVAAARTVHNIGKATRLIDASKTVGNMLKTLQNLGRPDRARVYWRNATKSAGNFLNPLATTTEFFQNQHKLNNLTKFAKTSAGFGAFYRDVRNARLAWGESGLEAGMVENEKLNELVSAYKEEHGRLPDANKQAEFISTAGKAALTTASQNFGLIFYSNKIVLDNLLTPFSPIRRLTQDIAMKNAAGKIVFNRRATKNAYEILEKGWKGFLKTAKNPRSYARVGLNYFRANFAEGIQEIGQEVIAGAALDYYKEHFDPDEPWYGAAMKGGYWASVADNIGKQFSAEGVEIFMSGFLMGGMVQPITRAGGALAKKDTYTRITDRKNWKAMKQERMDQLNEQVNLLNDFYNDPMQYLAPDIQNLVNQKGYAKGMKEANENGDARAFYDLKDLAHSEHALTALQMGRMDTFIERLRDDLNLTDEELAEMAPQGVSAQQYRGAIQTAIDRAEMIQHRYDTAKKEIKNPFNPTVFKRGTPEHKEEANNYFAWETALGQLVFMQSTFDRTIERMDSILRDAKEDLNLKDIAASDFNLLFKVDLTQKEIDALEVEIKALKDQGEAITPEMKKFRADKEKKLKLLKEFSKAITEVLATPVSEPTQQDEPLERGANRIDLDSGAESEAIKKAYKAFDEYIRFLTDVGEGHVFNKNVEKSFQKLIDFYIKDDESSKLVQAINLLSDPSEFSKGARRLAELVTTAMDNKKAQIKQALMEYKKLKESNELLQLLYDEGMFFDPQESVALFEEGKMPETFYYVENEQQVRESDPDYQKAQNLIMDWVENVMDIEITGRKKPHPYNSKTRDKFEDDERTYDDLAEQYGFDPAANETKVPLKQVLQTVIDSEYATPREKALARQLIRFAVDGETVTFKKGHATAGMYSAATQTIVDPRYSSHNYRGGNAPIEFVILHEEIHRRTIEELQKDGTFKGQIEALMAAANAYLESPGVREKWGEKMLYGMQNADEFVAEAMSNDYFQEFLAEVPYDDTTSKSAWTEFVDSVLDFLKNLFGREVSNTALNAAMNIITAKIDAVYGGVAPSELDTTLQELEQQRLAEIAAAEAEGGTKAVKSSEYAENIARFLGRALGNKLGTGPVTLMRNTSLTKENVEKRVNELFDILTLLFETNTTSNLVRSPHIDDTSSLDDPLYHIYQNLNNYAGLRNTNVPIANADEILRLVEVYGMDVDQVKAKIDYINSLSDIRVPEGVVGEEANSLLEAAWTELKEKDITPTEERKAEIDAKRQADLEKAKADPGSWGQVIMPQQRDTSGALTDVANYLKDTFGWNIEDGNFSASDKTSTWKIDGVTFTIPTDGGKMGGAMLFLGIDLEQLINAKYDAELAAAEAGAKPSTIKTEAERISGLTFKERVPALQEAGILTGIVFYALGRPVVVANIGGVSVPFYRSSTGTDGKTKGKWYPMFGMAARTQETADDQNWLMKGAIDEMEENYNNESIALYSEIINSTLNWDQEQDRTLPQNHPYIDFTNQPADAEAFNNTVFGKEELGFKDDGSYVDHIKAILDSIPSIEVTPTQEELEKKIKKINTKYKRKVTLAKKADKKKREEEALKKKPITGAAGTGNLITRATPMEDVIAQHPELAKNLLEAYKAELASRREKGEDVDPRLEQMSDEELMQTPNFRLYVSAPGRPTVTKIFDDYNVATGRADQPTEEPTTPSRPVPPGWTEELKRELAALGYTTEDRLAMEIAEGQAIVDAGITKAQKEEEEALAQRTQEQEFEEHGRRVYNEIVDIIASANTLEELNIAEQTAFSMMAGEQVTLALREAIGLNGAAIESMVRQRKEDLAFSVTFDDLRVGEVIQLNDRYRTLVLIKEKTDDMLLTHRVGRPESTHNIRADQVAEKVKYRYSLALEEVDLAPEQEMTDNEKELSNETQNVLNPEDIQQITQEGQNKIDTGDREDWINHINEC